MLWSRRESVKYTYVVVKLKLIMWHHCKIVDKNENIKAVNADFVAESYQPDLGKTKEKY